MQLDGDTKLMPLLDEHPYLLDILADLTPEFAKLRNPFVRKTMADVATLSVVASIGNLELDDLLAVLRFAIQQHTGEGVGEAPAGDALAAAAEEPVAHPPAGDGQQRLEALKSIIKDLHAGAPFEEVKKRFDEQFGGLSGAEIAAMEQQLVVEGMSPEEITKLCDVHVAVFRDALDATERPETIPGHPLHTFRLENAALGQVVEATRATLRALGESPTAAALEARREELRAGSRSSQRSTSTTCAKRTSYFPSWSGTASPLRRR